MLADTKAQLDFCVNLSLGGWLAGLLYIGLAVAAWRLPAPWMPVIAVIVGFGGYWLAASAAMNFGSYVKSAFDLYRGELPISWALTCHARLRLNARCGA